MTTVDSSTRTVALLDTTVHLDRRKSKPRSTQIESLISRFTETITTGISAVEFKATYIAECITIHNNLRRKGARYTAVRDSLLEKKHRQSRLRANIFNNLDILAGSSFSVTHEEDERLAKKARLKLEDTIPRLYQWLLEHSASVFLNSTGVQCDRAVEIPRVNRAAFPVNLPRCVRGLNKSCCVEALIRSRWPALKAKLPVLDNAANEQLIAQSSVLDEVCREEKAEMTVDKCRRAGDSLICLEVSGIATHAVSTNRRDWEVLSKASDIEFVEVRYEGETTQ